MGVRERKGPRHFRKDSIRVSGSDTMVVVALQLSNKAVNALNTDSKKRERAKVSELKRNLMETKKQSRKTVEECSWRYQKPTGEPTT